MLLSYRARVSHCIKRLLSDKLISKGVFVMKKRKPVFTNGKSKRYNGIFDPDAGSVTLDPDIVSSTEMTGAVPAAREEPYDEDTLEEYYF